MSHFGVCARAHFLPTLLLGYVALLLFPALGWAQEGKDKPEGLPPAADVAEAAVAPVITTAELKYAADTFWTLLAGILVFFMQAGFAMVETGFTRSKNAVNICMKNFMDFCFASLIFWAIGFALMFGNGSESTGNLFGTVGWFLSETSVEGETNFGGIAWANVPLYCKFFFQLVFAGTAATIVSGAMAERTSLRAYMLYSVIITGVIYPISGHWIWGAGWLADKGFWDFAGSTVVHSVGGWAGMMGSFFLGPRIGKYGSDGSVRAIPGHNIPLAALGVFILWMGWFGFNPGSTMALDPELISLIACTTNTAAAAGGIIAIITSRILFGKWDAGMALNGGLAGLVAITCPCAWVDLPGAAAIGAVAGVLVVFSVIFFDRTVRIDDPVGAISVHGVNGAWGTLALGLFCTSDGSVDGSGPGLGLFYGGDGSQLWAQFIGVAAVFAWTVVASGLLFGVIKYTIGLRVSEDEELDGLDQGEHGYEAYHGFVMNG